MMRRTPRHHENVSSLHSTIVRFDFLNSYLLLPTLPIKVVSVYNLMGIQCVFLQSRITITVVRE